MQPLREFRILGALYGFSGIYCSAIAAWIFHWMATTGSGWVFLAIPFTFLLLPCFAFFLATYGILGGRGWARTLGLVLSGGTIAIMFLVVPVGIFGVVQYLLSHPESYLIGAFIVSSLSLLVTNVLGIYYLTRPRVKQRLGS